MSKNQKYICSECGGTNVQSKAWVELNPLIDKCPDIDWSLGELNNSDDNWCNDCRQHVEIIVKDDES